MSIEERFRRRLMVLDLYEQGLRVSQCAARAGVSYETARRVCREADRDGFDLARQERVPRYWPVELKTEIGMRWLAGESAGKLTRDYGLPAGSYPIIFGRWLEDRKMVDPETSARATCDRINRAQKVGYRFEHWGKWLQEMRHHIETAKTQAPNEEKRQALDALHVELLEKSCALRDEVDTWQELLILLVTTLKAIHPVSRLCTIVGLARSTYYWAQGRSDQPNPDLEVVKAAFDYAQGRYGCRRITALIAQGFGNYPPQVFNHKKVARLMRMAGLKGACPRRKHYRSFAGTQAQIPNRLQRRFHADKPGKCLVTDITQISWVGSWYYFSPLLDLFNNEIVAWQLGKHPTTQLVTNMVKQYAQKADLTGTVIHTDQGGQYFSYDYRELIESLGAHQSMSRKGNCLDNSPAEAFFARLKTELNLNSTPHDDYESLEELINQYITWWNEERIVSKLHTSPVNYRQQHYKLTV